MVRLADCPAELDIVVVFRSGIPPLPEHKLADINQTSLLRRARCLIPTERRFQLNRARKVFRIKVFGNGIFYGVNVYKSVVDNKIGLSVLDSLREASGAVH